MDHSTCRTDTLAHGHACHPHVQRRSGTTVFNEQVEEGQKPDIPKLVKFARGKLRTKFLNAEMGITGANIAVAETGTLVIVTNEGNARLVTTLPKIHVAIVGLEKLMEKFDDVVPVLTALPKSATAQLMTSYVSMISGPVPNTDGTPKQLHVILMDNRRTEMSQDPKFKQAMQCIRCASCLNVCPVFRLVGGHVFGKIYTGGIGTILTAWFDALKSSDDIQSLCIQCGNCTEVCPGKIDIPGLILELRRRLAVEKRPAPGAEKRSSRWSTTASSSTPCCALHTLMQKPLQKDVISFVTLPFFLSEMTEFRSLPAIAEAPLPRYVQEDSSNLLARTKRRLHSTPAASIDFAYPGDGRIAGEDTE
jgi:L-lactate dehydrogenase complex protein LldF